jgi:hypothetical protein
MTYHIDPNILNTTYTVDANFGAVPPQLSGSIYTAIGTNGSWTSPPNTMTVQPSGQIKIVGKDADIDINGRSLKQFMDDVEQRLNLLRPNTQLEKEWDELKRLGDQYRALEKEINNKMTTWDILKTED